MFKKGEKVFLLGKNSLNWLEVYFAIIKTGAWVTPLNFRFTDDDIRFCAKTAEPVAFLFDEEFTERVHNLRKELTSIKFYSSIGGKGSKDMETMEDLIKKGSPSPVKVKLEDEDAMRTLFYVRHNRSAKARTDSAEKRHVFSHFRSH